MTNSDEIQRVRQVYAQRRTVADKTKYTLFDPAHHLLHFSRQRALTHALEHLGWASLQSLRILEVGCGGGDILFELLAWNAAASNLHGIDIERHDLTQAKSNSPSLNILCASAQNLPYADRTFDLVMQYTVFSSILDDNWRRAMAEEMRRVLNQHGAIISYDFWPNNPANPDVRGLTLKDVKSLFPSAKLHVQNIVLAPPLARRLARITQLGCLFLEAIPWFCTHHMIVIRPLEKTHA